MDKRADGHRLRAYTALAIVAVSILAAAMAWRASVADDEAATAQHDSEQNRLQRQQLESGYRTGVIRDIELFGRYEEHRGLAYAFERQAARATESRARTLRAAAQRERSLAARQLPLYRPVNPDAVKTGARFDAAMDLRRAARVDPELLALESPERLEHAAAAEHRRGVRFTGLAALFVAALVLLTFAELSRTGLARLFATAGVAVAGVGVALAIVV